MELINRGNTSILKKKTYFSSLLIEFFPVIKSSSFRKKNQWQIRSLWTEGRNMKRA